MTRGWFTRWRRRRALRRHPLVLAEWRAVLADTPCLHGLSAVERAHLRELSILFLQRKTLTGVQGLELSGRMRLQIVAEACLAILHLGIDYYDGWREVVVYPESFRVKRQLTDDMGLVSDSDQAMSGEAWERGPVILAWAELEADRAARGAGRSVVIHEFAHKLDMLNGRANGMPPLHPGMPVPEWTAAFMEAYVTLQQRITHHQRGCVDAYGATSPAEFFAVVSEHFFTAPVHLEHECPAVYRQLQLFYRQDPARRLAAVEHHWP
jgi:Mlc titration factor MtfA (ptsG expression regulator)